MVLFNHATREMTAKIVYYGPGLCGKTTNLLVIFDKLDPQSRGKMLSLATKTDRTLFFDLLPVDIGKVGNFNLKIQLYTVPGQVFYNETRKLVLKGADAVVFVADSQPTMVESNRDSFNNLIENLEQNQIDFNELPVVIQYNKRDLPGVLPVEEIQSRLGFEGYPFMEASALRGDGVMETFKLVSKITAKHLIKRLSGKGGKSDLTEERKPGKKVAAGVAAVSEEAAPEAFSPSENPFASQEAPFEGDAAREYDNAEEVSLEKLLEGRERPATFAGNFAVPFVEPDNEIEELPADSEIAEHEQPAPLKFPDASQQSPRSAPDEGGTDGDVLNAMRADIEALREDQARTRQALQKIAEEIGKLLSKH